jgi:hypothetical protein
VSSGNLPYSVDLMTQAQIDLNSMLQRSKGLDSDLLIRQAMLEVLNRLRQSARSIGEPQYHLPAMKMTVMSLTVPPLYILYGVHDDQNVVVLQRIKKI